MDPRNFLNESGIYMFEKLDYSDSQTSGSVSKMLAGTFMSGEVTDTDGATYTYADKFREVGARAARVKFRDTRTTSTSSMWAHMLTAEGAQRSTA